MWTISESPIAPSFVDTRGTAFFLPLSPSLRGETPTFREVSRLTAFMPPSTYAVSRVGVVGPSCWVSDIIVPGLVTLGSQLTENLVPRVLTCAHVPGKHGRIVPPLGFPWRPPHRNIALELHQLLGSVHGAAVGTCMVGSLPATLFSSRGRAGRLVCCGSCLSFCPSH